MWVHRVFFRLQDGTRSSKDFPIKASRNSTGIQIQSKPYKEIDEFVKEVEFTGCRDIEIKEKKK